MVSRVRLRMVFALGLALLNVRSAAAKGWDPLEYTAQGQLTHYPNLFAGLDPRLGSLSQMGPTFQDQGIDLAAASSSARRVGKNTKFSMELGAHSRLLRHTHTSQYTELSLQPGLRTKTMQYTLEGAWTPNRVVFPPGDDESGAFEDRTLVFGARRAFGPKLRGRLEGSIEHRDFKSDSLSGRDAHSRALYALFTVTPQKGVDLNFELEWDSDRANDVKYDKDTRFSGFGVSWNWQGVRCETSARAVIRRYRDPDPTGSNFERRDQRLELRTRVSREVRAGLKASLAWGSTSQTSNRDDNSTVVLFDLPYNRSYNFTSSTFTLGLEWTGGGKKP
ncbi:MAG: hypothetical protein ABL977_09890 [Candidatus Eisenbacteria bacterium]